jgi:hypothetical protein
MKTLFFVSLFALLLGCVPKTSIDELALQQTLDSLKGPEAFINHEVVESILQQIPSPLETSMLLKQSGIGYDRVVVNSPSNLSTYNSVYKKALNLGIYGADLGYSNIYGQNAEGIRYLSAIKTLANDLSIGQFFDLKTISKLAINSNNLDSLLLVTTQNFNAINSYLQEQNRSNLSVLLLVGGWIEAMEITCHAATQNLGNRELVERVGEQKIILEQLTLLLSFYKNDPDMDSLHEELEQLKSIFDGIDITYTYVESSIEMIDGVAVIKDNSTTSISITNQDVLDIQNKINSIRTKIVN